jgi:hypothetical protein
MFSRESLLSGVEVGTRGCAACRSLLLELFLIAGRMGIGVKARNRPAIVDFAT